MVQDRLLLGYSGDKPHANDIHLQGAHNPRESRPGLRTCRGIPSGAARQWGGGSTVHCETECPISTAITLLTVLPKGGLRYGKRAWFSIYIFDTLMTPDHSVILQKDNSLSKILYLVELKHLMAT